MDVVVTPVSGAQKAWSLTDRLGRKVGSITQSDEAKFVIAFTDSSADGPHTKIDSVQPSLGAAMDAIAVRLKGMCQLSDEKDL